MSKVDFLPKRGSDLDMFEGNFLEKLAVHSASLGLDPSIVASITEEINKHRLIYANMISKRAQSRSASEENNSQRKITVKEIRRIGLMIKTLKNYTSAIGDDLQIIGSEKTKTDITELQPVLRSKVNGEEVILRFNKEGTDGIRLFSRRGNETEYTPLESTTKSPYIDKRPKLDLSKPEQRDYYAVFFDNVRDIGKRSDVIKTIVS